jgi:hypothetical protein
MPSNKRYGRADPADSVRGTCTAVVGSMTAAMRARTVLAEAAIRVAVVKVSSGGNAGGCAYGVDFSCTRMSNVKTVLNGAGIRVREFLRG